MLKKEELKEKAMQTEQELTEAELDQVTGAGNPFDNVPRVPTQPIDEDVRKKI